MSEKQRRKIGTIGWVDLTVPDAGPIRDFYSDIIGWRSEPCSQGDYDDYNMIPPGDEATPAAGVVNQRGINKDIPSVWMVYIVVEDIHKSLDTATRLGAAIIHGPRGGGGHGWLAVIRDPAGAHCALWQEAP